MPHRQWSDLSPGQRRGFVVASMIQIGLAAAAWTDLARRSPEQVNGRKPLRAAAIAVNFLGSLAYGVRYSDLSVFGAQIRSRHPDR